MKSGRVFAASVVVTCCMVAGCIENQGAGQTAPFEDNQLDAVLGILVDLSGSFHESWDGRAYDVFLDVSDRFFTEAMGKETRLVIGQLSGNDEVLLFEGRPSDLRKRFRSPQELAQFLKDKSDPSSSHVFEATRRTLDYVGGMSGVTPDTRLLTVVFSDLHESEVDRSVRQASEAKLRESLRRYEARGGGLAFYFVAEDERERWNTLLRETGFSASHFVIESSLTSSPQLPRFD